MAGAFVCRHQEGVWNAVLADQFGEHTYIRYGTSKGGLVGMTISAEQVACRVRSFPLCQHVSHTFDIMFDPCPDDDVTTGVTTKHKEEGIHRRELDTADRNLVIVLECAVPPSIIDEFGILRKVKAQLMKNLVIVSTEPSNPDYVIVAAGQLLYHIVWPSDGTVYHRYEHGSQTAALQRTPDHSCV